VVVDTSAIAAILLTNPTTDDMARRSYALAIAAGDIMLVKGDDFIHTDVRPALPPAEG
jgi:uncharacterized protein with PIN domain